MLPILIFLGIAVPATELFLLILISNSIGFWPTVGIIVATGVLGAVLWRWQGFGVFGRLKMGIGSGASPGDALLDGAMIFFAGGLLLTPGVLTDVLGFLLLIPFTRSIFKKWIFQWLKSKFKMVDISQMPSGMPFGPFGMPPSEESFNAENDLDDKTDGDIIEGEIIDGDVHNSKPKIDS